MADHFIIIGAQRSGTTYLTRVLGDHPQIQIALPLRPEPKYFLSENDGGVDQYLARHFTPIKPTARLFGEKSTSYIESPAAAVRIKAVLPSARILVLFRDPVERAISNVRFSQSNGFEALPTAQALTRELDQPEAVIDARTVGVSVSPQAYLARGRYADFLPPYIDTFGRERIKIMTTEALVGSHQEIADLYNWLGVDTSFVPPAVHERVNAGEAMTDQAIAPQLRERLHTYFRESNDRLADRFGVDIGAWGT